MSLYDNVVGGKLRLKGKALDVKVDGLKKKKKRKSYYAGNTTTAGNDFNGGWNHGNTHSSEDAWGNAKNEEVPNYMDHFTAAERRFMEQREKIHARLLAKNANKSHRDRIEEFNHYLANLSEHYDIPKVGPG